VGVGRLVRGKEETQHSLILDNQEGGTLKVLGEKGGGRRGDGGKKFTLVCQAEKRLDGGESWGTHRQRKGRAASG